MSHRGSTELSTEDVSSVRRLAAEVARLDGAPPLSDQALVRLRSLDPAVRHFRTAAGYAQAAAGGDAVLVELVVGPGAERDRGADELLAAVAAALPDRRLLAWAHGAATPVADALSRHGFRPVRRLLKMARPLDNTAIAAAADPLPDGVRIRPFEVGRDEAAWLAVNARAFAHHPEQAEQTADDLAAREAEEWFDPAGFLLATDSTTSGDGDLLGFHWTKLHPGEPSVGEVYVIGVDPDQQGRHLGGALLSAGLSYLYGRGARTAMLYADDSNTAAIRLYEKRGFEPTGVDTQYER